MKKLLAFNNDPILKEKMIEEVKWHQEQDKIVKGRYGDETNIEEWRGCAVGCSLNSLNKIKGKKIGFDTDVHERYEKELGIPEILARLEDGLFEEMGAKEAKKFPLRFIEAIPVGADLSMVFTKLVIWEWEDKEYGLSQIEEIQEDKELYDCCEAVVSLYKRHLAGEKVMDSEWQKLEDLSDKVYEAEAWAWARARARAGAWAEYKKQILITANKLLEILSESK